MNAKSLKLDAGKIVGNGLLLTSIKPAYVYENGAVTEKIRGYKYVVTCPLLEYDKLSVRIDEPKQSNIELMSEVFFDGLELILYADAKNVGVSAKATAIHKAAAK